MRYGVALLLIACAAPLAGAQQGKGPKAPPKLYELPQAKRLATARQLGRASGAERAVIATITKIEASPGFWCGVVATRQFVTYRVSETLLGPADAGPTVRVGHLLVSGSALVAAQPRLRQDLFQVGQRVLLLLERKGKDAWDVPSERRGTYALDRARIAEPGQVWRALIDLPHLQPFLHAELPERVPLWIVEHELLRPAELRKFEQPVRFASRDALHQARQGAFFELTGCALAGKTLTLRFEYAVEGVVGSASFQRDAAGDWRLTKSELAER